MAIPDTIWRQYDIRGIYPTEVNVDAARQVGRAFGTTIRRLRGKRVCVAGDARVSSPELRPATIEGILSTGCDVDDLGMAPTPVMYFAVAHFGYDGGLIVSASHNPPQYNGFKSRTNERALFGDDIQEMRKMVVGNDFTSGKGAMQTRDVAPDYIDYMKAAFSLHRSLKVAIDSGNGATGPIAVQMFEALGCEVVPLFTEPDGRFPNHIPDPTVPANMVALREAVRQTNADIGLGIDGDGDRVAAMTPDGRLLWGDKMLSIFVDSIIGSNPGPVVFDVKCSMTLVERIRAVGGTPVMWKTGYPLLQAKMRETKSVLAGEMSGHMYLADRYYGYDDGMYAGARMVEVIANGGVSLNDIADSLPDYPGTPELRLHCDEAAKSSIVPAVVKRIPSHYDIVDVDGVRFSTDSGWGLIRVSNTEPAVVARFEAKTKAELATIMEDALRILDGLPIDIEPVREIAARL